MTSKLNTASTIMVMMALSSTRLYAICLLFICCCLFTTGHCSKRTLRAGIAAPQDVQVATSVVEVALGLFIFRFIVFQLAGHIPYADDLIGCLLVTQEYIQDVLVQPAVHAAVFVLQLSQLPDPGCDLLIQVDVVAA